MEPVPSKEEPHPSDSLLLCKSILVLVGRKEAVQMTGGFMVILIEVFGG